MRNDYDAEGLRMEKFRTWLADFMRGRYGHDELNRTLCIVVIVLLVISLFTQALGWLLGSPMQVISRVFNWLGMLGLIAVIFRSFSRNFEKRRAENEWFLERKASGSEKARKRKTRNNKEFKYLICPQCKQEMRVPRGKGTIKVKCPKCGQETIVKS